MAIAGVPGLAFTELMLTRAAWSSARDNAVRRLGRPVLVGYVVLLAVGVIIVVGALVMMHTGH